MKKNALLLIALFVLLLVPGTVRAEDSLKERIVKAILKSDLPPAQRIQHFLNRIAGGSDLSDVTYERFEKMREGHIDARASAEAMAAEVVANLNEIGKEDPAIEAKIRALYTFNGLSPSELVRGYGRAFEESMVAANQYRVKIRHDVAGAHLLRSTLDNRGLKNTLFDFWFDHFNVDSKKTPLDIISYAEFVRNHMAGSFEALLSGVAKHPAMLVYLDNIKSVKQSGDLGPNENYARELMELHTFGVGPTAGVYTQGDIQAVALLLTGWGISSTQGMTKGHEFKFYETRHDTSVKRVIGVTYAAEGVEEGEKLLKFLAHHNRTANNIVNKLVRKLVTEDMEAAIDLRAELRSVFLQSSGDLGQVYETIVSSPLFWSSVAYNAKYKRPLEIVASALKLTGASRSTLPLVTVDEGLVTIQRMGQDFFTYGAPTGPSDRAMDWITSSNAVSAIRYGISVASYRHPSASNRSLFHSWENWVANLPALGRFGKTFEAFQAFYDLKSVQSRMELSPLASPAEQGTLFRLVAAHPDTVGNAEKPVRSMAAAFIGSKDFLKK